MERQQPGMDEIPSEAARGKGQPNRLDWAGSSMPGRVLPLQSLEAAECVEVPLYGVPFRGWRRKVAPRSNAPTSFRGGVLSFEWSAGETSAHSIHQEAESRPLSAKYYPGGETC